MYEYTATLVSVHDGDTFCLDVDLGFDIHHVALDVRLAGFDCPELARPDGLGEKARDFVVAWFGANGPTVTVHTMKDRTEKYGRYLAIVIGAGGSDLAHDLVQADLAKPYDGHGPKPEWL